jgi:tetratricopeptide (TPR) repeat protein
LPSEDKAAKKGRSRGTGKSAASTRKNALTLRYQSLAFLDKKEYEAAIAAYEEAIRLDPKDARLHNELGLAFYAKKKYEAAIAAYKEAIRLNPKYALAHLNLGNVFLEKKENEAAIAAYKEAIRLDPKYAAVLNSQASSLVTSPRGQMP